MTEAKKLKKAIRARSRKTGESYTASRRQLLIARGKRTPRRAAPPPVSPPSKPSIPARATSTRTGISDASVVKKTGHGLDHWFATLDAFKATEKGHAAAARHLYEDHGVPGWHCQMITVAYERARGVRATNQACTGDFQVSISKVVSASVADVAEAIGNARQRAAWLGGADPALSGALTAALTGAKPKQLKIKDANNARLRYPWDGSIVEIRIAGKPKGGASVAADNTKLVDATAVERRRAQWRVALEALRAHLSR